MITEKDRELIKDICGCINIPIGISILNQNVVSAVFKSNAVGDIEQDELLDIISRIRAESADQARKEAAERAVAFLKKEWYWFNDDACYADELRAAILDDSTAGHIPDTGEKLAIAVKALEYVASKSLPSDVFGGHYSRLQDACAKASDALREIQ